MRRISVGDSLHVTEGDDVDGLILTNIEDFSLNDLGEVAFGSEYESLTGQENGIFCEGEVVARSGSIVGGGLLASVRNPSMNNAGEIVFWADFLDQKRAIIKATPIDPGDFDTDGDVDGDDFLIWQAGFNVDDRGDADWDGDTDGDDFLIWQSQFGSGSGAGAVVPEPSSMALLFALGLALCLTRRSLRQICL